MVRLKNLQLQGICGFRDNQRVDFPDNGLFLIRGESGSGKTSVLNGLAYVLDIMPTGYAATDLQSWEADAPALQVVLGLEVDGKPVVLSRGKKTFVKYGDSDPITGSKAYGEELKKIFAAGPAILSALTYRSQKSPGLFLSRTDSEKKEFLSEVLGLNAIESAVDAADTKTKALEQKRKALEPLMAQMQSTVATYEQSLKDIDGTLPVNPEPDLLESESATAALPPIEMELTAIRSRISQLSGSPKPVSPLGDKLVQCRAMLVSLRENDAEAKRIAESMREEVRTAIKSIEKQLWSISAFNLKSAEGQLAEARKNICFTCKQTWIQDQQAISDLEATVATIKAALDKVPELKKQKVDFEAQLQAIVYVQDPNLDKMVAIEKKLEAELRVYQQTPDPALIELRQLETGILDRLNAAQQRARMAESKAATIRSAISNYQTRKKSYEAQLAAQLQSLKKEQAEYESLGTEMNQELDFSQALGREGFLGAIFEEVLREISDETNRRLANLANVGSVTLDFRTESTTAKGTVKKAIAAVVNVRGHQTKLKTGVSGGMESSIELATDLSVATVIQNRTGAAPGWLCLDEVFNGMPVTTKEAAMELLREFSTTKLVIVIDHGSEFKEMFSSGIEVEMVDGVSRIKP